MLYGLFVLLACQLLGEATTRLLGLSVPGPVIGIVLVFAYQAVHERLSSARAASLVRSVEGAGDGLLGYLGLMFIPAGVGIAQSYGLVFDHWIAILATLVLSTVATLVVTVAVFRLVRRHTENERA